MIPFGNHLENRGCKKSIFCSYTSERFENIFVQSIPKIVDSFRFTTERRRFSSYSVVNDLRMGRRVSRECTYPLPGAVLRIRASKQRKYATGGGGVFPFLHAEAGEAQPYYT